MYKSVSDCLAKSQLSSDSRLDYQTVALLPPAIRLSVDSHAVAVGVIKGTRDFRQVLFSTF